MTHVEMLDVLYFQKDIDENLLKQYIEVSQIGDHFSYYCFGKNPRYDLFIKLYNENDTLKTFVNKKDKRTIDFIYKAGDKLKIIANTLLDENDFDKYKKMFSVYTINDLKKRKNGLNYKFYKYYKQDIVKVFKNNPMDYLNYFSAILKNIDEKEQEKILKYFDNYLLDEKVIDKLLSLPLKEEQKNKIKTNIMLKQLGVK